MMYENDPLDGGGLELKVEFDDEFDDEEFGFAPPEEIDEYEEEENEAEYEDDWLDNQPEISNQPTPTQPHSFDTMSSLVGDSKLMKDILYYRAQGYSDDQILDGMSKLRSQSAPSNQKPPEFDTIGEEAAWFAQQAVKSQLSEVIAPLQQKIAQYEQQMQQSQLNNLKSQNGRTFSNTLNSSGLNPDSLSDTEYRRLDAAMERMYPGVDFNVTPVTPQMAEGIVRLAFNSNRNRSTSTTSNMIRQQNAPKIMGGNISSGAKSGTSRTFKVDGVPKNERVARIKAFLG